MKPYFYFLLIGIFGMYSCADEPVPCFEYEITDIYTHTVKFDNCSELAIDYEWDFGDGSTSTDNNPEHVYASSGTYQVKLIANGEKRSAETSRSVEVNESMTMTFESDVAASKRNKNTTHTISLNAINGVQSVTGIHYYSDRKWKIVDSAFATPLENSLSFTQDQQLPLIYRPTSRYEFVVTDGNEVMDTFVFTLPSDDKVDTTSGRVLSGVEKDIDPFSFKYSYGYAILDKRQPQGLEFLSVYLYDSDGDHILISEALAKESTQKSFVVEAHDEQNGKTHEKERSRSAANDQITFESIDMDKMQVTGSMDMDLNLESEFHDVLKIDFAEIKIAIIDEKR